jgi:hypothetical protein
MVTNNQELFSNTKDLIEQLNILGDTNSATQLQSAMSISSMPTEILGEMRITAKEISKKNNNDLIKKKLQLIIQYIDNAFSE